MNSIKIAGEIIKKEKSRKNDTFLNVIVAVPLHMKVYGDGNFKQLYNYVSLSLFGLENDQYDILRKGNFVEIIGQIVGNSNEDGKKKRDLIVIPKSIMKGVRK